MDISIIIYLIAIFVNINALFASPRHLIVYRVKVHTEFLGAQPIIFVRKYITKIIYLVVKQDL